MSAAHAAVQLLVFPGALYAVSASFFLTWLHRKVNARLQGRIGPPFYQPFFDVIKLAAKTPVPRPPLQGLVMTALPLGAVTATLAAAALLPVFPAWGGFSGDLVLLVALIEAGPLLGVLAGYASRSLWGGLGSSREAVMTAAYNLPFLTALIALAQLNGFSLTASATGGPAAVRVLVVIALLLCLPAKLHLNPFSIASAEQEIYAGITTEYDGPRLALWELAHGLEWVALVGLVAALAFPVTLAWYWHLLAFLAVSVLVVVLLSVLAASTARLKLAQTARWFWLWGFGIALSALGLAFAGI
ncbi:MAG TPA: NADH-quinone oxidoreductase subunit H [Kineosporiaceae bacterium]|nr:NADH-quinone oxidoreductase subunit H [Kineosporiaceae bacterium]